ncbi:hypothetical protein JR316_0009929 [Psilocybe cubensis]|uniref:Uncharacterized protein n=2 Tax=Psilocybe cubensis TaxID=181762 RepID=A0ACB8GQ64_PSICU|nr:hypothetical protein JR316_0009929 [Psilocybe cubensis]KAH9477703.1 hypothetical protein JR316_0009929 [Psilocybe cubensis]
MASSEPILSSIAGIDPSPRYLSPKEVAELTDWFGQWLAKTPISSRQLTLRSLLKEVLPADSYSIFAVADGIPIVYDHANPDNPLNSVSRHLRFIIIALPDKALQETFKLKEAILRRTLCIVGSSSPDSKSKFLQCASWDPKGLNQKHGFGLMHFYERLGPDWIYVGNSLNAFNTLSINRGPFDGHVGGGLIMKELTSPWTHWFDTNRDDFISSLGSTKGHPSKCDPNNALNDVLFSGPNGPPLSLVRRAEDLEPIVELSVSKWYDARFAHDFLDPDDLKPLPKTTAVRDWVGHILLSRSMNIATSPTSNAEVKQQANINGIPATLFFNLNAIERLLPDAGPSKAYTVDNAVYVQAVESLGLSLYYDDFSTDPPTQSLAVKGSEGPFAFPIIEPGLEDYQGIRTLVNKSSLATLLPQKAITAMLMVDFYNPIYSARREGLMQYVPHNASLKEDGKTYDAYDQFLANLKASPASKDPKSAEFELLQLLDTPDESYVEIFTKRVNAYLEKVAERMNSEANIKVSAVQEYMTLADGRRRLYRGRENQKESAGLNEFLLTLPIMDQALPLIRMMEDGTVTDMDTAEIAFFSKKNQEKIHALDMCYASAPGLGGCPAMMAQRHSP